MPEIERFALRTNTARHREEMVADDVGGWVKHSDHLADKAAELEDLAGNADAEAERWQRKRAECKQDEAKDRASGKLKKGHSYEATWNYYEGLARASEYAANRLRERAERATEGAGMKRMNREFREAFVIDGKRLDANGVNEYGVAMCQCKPYGPVHAWEPGEWCGTRVVPQPPADQQQHPTEEGGRVETALEAAAQMALKEIDAMLEFLLESGLIEEGGGLPLYQQGKLLTNARVKLAEALYVPMPPSSTEEGEQTGTELIAAERRRQVEQEGWTPEHDDQHDDGELARAAAAYALVAGAGPTKQAAEAERLWPFTDGWKPSEDEIRNLVKAGALIAAEIDRLQRLTPGSTEEERG